MVSTRSDVVAPAGTADSLVEDRRVRRSRAALRQAIVALVLERGFHSITGEDIADHADVTRATFYKHYQNKEDLLNDVVDDFSNRVVASFGGARSGRFQRLLEAVIDDPDVCRLILRGEGDGLALRRFTAAVEAVIDSDYAAHMDSANTVQHRETGNQVTGNSVTGHDLIDRQLAVSMRAAAIVAAVGWFLDHGDAGPAQISTSVLDVLEPSWSASLGRGVPS